MNDENQAQTQSRPVMMPNPAPDSAEAALMRAQARARDRANRPKPDTTPAKHASGGPTVERRHYEPSLIDEVASELEGWRGLTYCFMASDSQGAVAEECGQTLPAAVGLADNLAIGFTSGSSMQCFCELEGGPLSEEARDKTAAIVRDCLQRPREPDDIQFALAWFVAGSERAYLDLKDISTDEAFDRIGEYLTDEFKWRLAG